MILQFLILAAAIFLRESACAVAVISPMESSSDAERARGLAYCRSFGRLSPNVYCASGIKEERMQAWRSITLDPPGMRNPDPVCVIDRWECNGVVDCNRGEDEENCLAGRGLCPISLAWFRVCRSEIKEERIEAWKRVLKRELSDNPVPAHEVSHKCVPPGMTCDGVEDCYLGEDELGCFGD